MSWTKKNVHPGKIVSTSQEVEVQILEVDSVKRRVSLGLKQTMRNPWEVFVESHPPGSVVEGEVKNKTEFGLFLGLDGDVDGMVHLSDLDWKRPGEQVIDEYKKGDMVKAQVLDVDVEKERISLGVKQLQGDPMETAGEMKRTARCRPTGPRSGPRAGRATPRAHFGRALVQPEHERLRALLPGQVLLEHALVVHEHAQGSRAQGVVEVDPETARRLGAGRRGRSRRRSASRPRGPRGGCVGAARDPEEQGHAGECRGGDRRGTRARGGGGDGSQEAPFGSPPPGGAGRTGRPRGPRSRPGRPAAPRAESPAPPPPRGRLPTACRGGRPARRSSRSSAKASAVG